MTKIASYISSLVCLVSFSMADESDTPYYYEHQNLAAESLQQQLANTYPEYLLEKYNAQNGLVDRQSVLDDPVTLSLIIGAANLIATGGAWASNRAEIDDLKSRASRLETILSSTCNRLNDITNVAAPTAAGNAAANEVVLRAITGIASPTCNA